MLSHDIEQIEFDLFIKAIYKRHGYDFGNYSKASILRRLKLFLEKSPYSNLSECISPLLRDENFFGNLLSTCLISVTELFRDPSFFKTCIQKIVPILKTYPFIKIWHAGCATGEEVYSMAILLTEMGFSKKFLLYGTDINHEALRVAQEGIYRIDELERASLRYTEAGGKYSLSHYYHQKYGYGKFLDSLKENVVFSTHNLDTDGIFGDMHVILCRNVLIYFKRPLQNKVISLFQNSLVHRGFLCLGPKESMDFMEKKDKFEVISEREKIFRKL
ncbi:MAG: CheR family methyltransferase [Parachlamydiales bacterium]|jgi:chemotaxis protein methyltransferase CheR